MASINEVRRSDKQTIRDLPLGTVFKYKNRWYIRSDIYFHDDMELTFRQLGQYVMIIVLIAIIV